MFFYRKQQRVREKGRNAAATLAGIQIVLGFHARKNGVNNPDDNQRGREVARRR